MEKPKDTTALLHEALALIQQPLDDDQRARLAYTLGRAAGEINSFRLRMHEIRELAARNRYSLAPSRAELERIAVIAEGQEALL